MRSRITLSSTLPGAFDAAADRYPDRVAVDDLTRSLTYRELSAKADRIAGEIQACGAGPEEAVGLCAGSTVDLLAGMLAILKAGCAYVPLPPQYPSARLTAMARQLDLRLVVADGPNAPLASSLAARTVDVSGPPGRPGLKGPPGRPGGLAYVMFTSGSSGAPKGVMVEHASVISLLEGCSGLFDLDERDVWVMTHSYAFDFSVWEIWGALSRGGTLVVVPADVVRSPELMWQVCASKQVTVLNVTPSYFAELTAAMPDGHPEAALRYVIFGGEALPMATLRPWYARFQEDGPQLVNMYGITETTVHATAQFLTTGIAEQRASLIGKPLPHLQILLLDERQRPVADGEAGEIYLCGAGVARGYHGLPEVTAERFAVLPGARCRSYRSGDLARRGTDGALEYLGRADAQVKVRGFRVEPGEVEACMLAFPGVRQAVVAALDDDAGRRLAAYFVADSEVTGPELRAFVQGHLPDFMVPAFIRRVDAIPLTVNGKVDHRALRRPDAAGAGGGAPAEGGVTATLARIWHEVLGVPAEPDEDFFAAGGDSMTAIRLVRACRSGGVDFKIAELYQHATIRQLAVLVDRRSADRVGQSPQA